MRSLIRDSIVLPAPAEALYGMYLDPAKNAAITGAPVTILTFVPEGKAGRIDLVQLDVPVVDYQGVSQGWEQ
jgi:hypothetical protein